MCICQECRKLPYCPGSLKGALPSTTASPCRVHREPGQQIATTAHRVGARVDTTVGSPAFFSGLQSQRGPLALCLFCRRAWQCTQDHMARLTIPSLKLSHSLCTKLHTSLALLSHILISQTSLSETISFLQGHVGTVLNTGKEQNIGKNIKVGHTQKNGC